MVSVIIPVYNVEKYLSRCLDSIINQTYRDLQIICINDGSTDNSIQILKKYAAIDNRIVIVNQENKGLSEARNAGLDIANGEYVSFIDSDDWIDLDYYEVLVDLIEKNDADIVMAGMRWVFDNRITKNKTKQCIETKFSNIVHNYPTGSVCDKLFKLSYFSNIRFIKDRFYEDNIVLLQITKKTKKVIFENTVSYYYFNNSNSICREISVEKQRKRNCDKIYMIKQITGCKEFENLCKKERYELNDFLLRTLAQDLLFKKSEFYNELVQLFGKKYIFRYKLINLVNGSTMKYICRNIIKKLIY